jgi:PAS domain-containing protein
MNQPIPNSETARLADSGNHLDFDGDADRELDRITNLACLALEVPVSFVGLAGKDRIRLLSRQGLDQPEIPRPGDFCELAILEDSVLAVSDAAKDARFADQDTVTGPPRFTSYADAPLRDKSGLPIGTLSVRDIRPREFSSAQLAILSELADLASAHLERRRFQRADRENRADLLQETIDSMDEGISVWNSENRLLAWNAAFGALTDVSDTDLRPGASLLDVLRQAATAGRSGRAIRRNLPASGRWRFKAGISFDILRSRRATAACSALAGFRYETAVTSQPWRM